MTGDFAHHRRSIVPTPSQPAVHLEERWQRARDEQEIVEPKPKERNLSVRFDAPAIQSVERTTHQAERIQSVAKLLHNSARIKKPKPVAKPSFKKKTNMQTR